MGEKDIDEESRYHMLRMGGDTMNCKWCETKIGLTDVEGHYSGVCKECTDSLPVDELDALRSDNWRD